MTYPPNNDPYGNQAPPPGYGAPQAAPGYGAPQAPYGAPAVAYASWIQRVGASFVDGLCIAPFYILAGAVGTGVDPVTKLPTLNAMYYVFYLLGLGVWVYNRGFQQGKTGQSWGKKALGLRLVSEQTGQPIGFGMSFVRELAHFVDAVICFIGYLFPLWDAKKQTLADKIIKTLVVR